MSGVEVALLGAAASGGAAATSGLIGTAGALSMGTALSTLSTGLTFASVGSSLFGGMQQASAIRAQSEQEAYALNMAAREDTLEAKQEAVRGKQETNDMMENLMQTIASQRLAYINNGVDPGFGTPENLGEATRDFANLQMGMTRRDAQIRTIARRRQAFARREESLNTISRGKSGATSALLEGVGRAGGGVADLITRRQARG